MLRFQWYLRDLLHELILEIGELESPIKAVEKHLAALASQTPSSNGFAPSPVWGC
jgi:hypothetical protein